MTPKYSPTDWGMAGGATVSFAFALIAIFRPADVLPANDQAQITAMVVSLITFVSGLVINRVGKHIAGAR